jgi:hypothetical protein
MRQTSEVELRSLLQKRVAQLLAPLSEVSCVFSDFNLGLEVKDVLAKVAQRLNCSGWSSYLVGGTLRDLLVADHSEQGVQPRDIDIIVRGATREQLQDLLGQFLVLERLTRFGGLHLSRSFPSGSRVLFDIWTLADTWGFHSQQIVPRIEDFPETTFLNIDSCAVELKETEGKERALFEKGFFTGIAKRVLDMNYEPNPYPFVCAARALVIAVQLDFVLSRALAEFVLHHSAAGGVEALIEAQQSHYGAVRCDAEELERWLREIERHFDSGKDRIRIEVPESRRLELRGEGDAAGSQRQQATSS